MNSEPVPAPAPAPAAPPALAAAWPRYWARSLDVTLWLLLLALLYGAFAPPWVNFGAGLDSRLTDQILGIVLLPFALAGDALIYALFGNTPGKWLAGLAVRDAAGSGRLPPLRYLGRSVGVYVNAFALGVGLIALFALVHQYRRVSSGELTSWDQRQQARVVSVRGGPWRTGITAALYLALLAGSIGIGFYFRNLTPEQQLQLLASAAAPGSPTMVDEHTRFDRVFVAPGRVLEYDYTLLDVSAEDDPGFAARVERASRAELVREFCTDLTMIADLGGSVRWRYADKRGQLLHAIEVSKRDCPARR